MKYLITISSVAVLLEAVASAGKAEKASVSNSSSLDKLIIDTLCITSLGLLYLGARFLAYRLRRRRNRMYKSAVVITDDSEISGLRDFDSVVN